MIRKYHNHTLQTNPRHRQNTVWAHKRLIRETPLEWHLARSPMVVRFQMFPGMKNSEYDQEIPQSPTADKPMAPRGRATQPQRDTRETN